MELAIRATSRPATQSLAVTALGAAIVAHASACTGQPHVSVPPVDAERTLAAPPVNHSGFRALVHELRRAGHESPVSEARRQLGVAPPEALVELVGHVDSVIAGDAADVFGELGEAARPHAHAFASRLPDLPRSVETRVLYALGNLGPHAAGAGEVLLGIARSDRGTEAAITLAALGTGAVDIVRGLIGSDGDRDRYLGAWIVGQMSPESGAALVADVASLFDDADVEIFDCAVRAIEHLGPQAAPAVPGLLRALDRPGLGERSREGVLLALQEIGAGAAAAVPAMVRLLGSSDDDEAAMAGEVLIEVGEASLPALEAVANGEDEPARSRAREAIALIQERRGR